MSRDGWMGLAFAVGSACFLVGPLPGYARLVGGRADAITFFVGSVFFTTGGLLQSASAYGGRHQRGEGRAAWWSATVQSAGTIFFNVSTFRAIDAAFANPQYDRLVWRPDAFGSVCFLVSGAIAYHASPRHGWVPVHGTRGWWQPAVNLLGCGFFGVSAIAGYVVPSSGSVLDLAAANWNTCLGALCFLVCAIATVHTACRDARRPSASPRPGDALGRQRAGP